MEEEYKTSAPLEDEGHLETRRLTSGYGWGGAGPGGMPMPPMTAPGYGYGNPSVPYAPPPYADGSGFAGGNNVSGSGSYPVIGFNPAIIHNNASMKSYTECPVCMELLFKPIYQCSNGHVICNVCIDKVEFCRQCNVPMTGPKIRNVALEQICESIEINCPNKGEGCEVVTTGGELQQHLNVCEYRAIPICTQLLGLQDCTEKVTSLGSLVHLKDVHEAQIMEQANFKLRLVSPSWIYKKSEVASHNNKEGFLWEPIIVTGALDNDICLICATTSNGNLCLTGYLLNGSFEDCKLYRMKLQIDSNKSRMEWTGCLLSVRHHNYADHQHMLNLNSFQIPLQALNQFVKAHSNGDDEFADQVKLKVKVGFWKCEDAKPYQTCFVDDDGEKVSLEKVVLQSKPYSYEEGHASFSSSATTVIPETMSTNFEYSHPVDYSTGHATAYYPSDYCTNCFRSLSGVIYQCLQCGEAKYFCRACIEASQTHSHHLTLRISNAMQQPLGAVVYECTAGELN